MIDELIDGDIETGRLGGNALARTLLIALLSGVFGGFLVTPGWSPIRPST